MSKPHQLHLLADHIKLSLLERKRAQALHIDGSAGGANTTDTQDGHISRSLEQFRDGLNALNEERRQAAESGDTSITSQLDEALPGLSTQLEDLTSQFHGFTTPSSAQTLISPNSAALAPDFVHAQSTSPPSSRPDARSSRLSKSVRFSDSPAPASPGGHSGEDDHDPNADALFSSYRDDPALEGSGYHDEQAGMTNAQIHSHHSQILDEQDEHLDRLGESISRQRELSMQIGDELDDHVAMLDDMEAVTDRTQSRLDRAGRTLGKVARGARENKQMTAIFVLIVILILLIAILK